MTNVKEHSNHDRRISIFDAIMTLLGISSEYLFYIFHRTMQKAHVELIYRPFETTYNMNKLCRI